MAVTCAAGSHHRARQHQREYHAVVDIAGAHGAAHLRHVGRTELWVWRHTPEGWALKELPPAAGTPGLGYAEFACWVPGTPGRLLVAREGIADGRTTRRFEGMAL